MERKSKLFRMFESDSKLSPIKGDYFKLKIKLKIFAKNVTSSSSANKRMIASINVYLSIVSLGTLLLSLVIFSFKYVHFSPCSGAANAYLKSLSNFSNDFDFHHLAEPLNLTQVYFKIS